MQNLTQTKFIIGLTGGIGSGKSTVTNLFHSQGIDIVDADIVAREVVAPKSKALCAITERFGHEFLLSNGELNRARLRQQVFNNPEDKRWLNELLHPLIRNNLSEQLALTQSPYAILVAPLLIENKLHEHVNQVLVVDVSVETQIERAAHRDNNSIEQIKKIIAAQVSRTERLKTANDIIDNEADISQPNILNQMTQHVVELDEKYRKMAENTLNNIK